MARARSASPPDLLAAAHFAAQRHRKQKRKGADRAPYVNHVLQVADILARVGKVGDRDVLLAAILHDTIEDTGTKRAELARLFGSKVASLVAEVSDDKSPPKPTRKRLQIEHAPHLSRDAKLVKLADKISNVEEVGASPAKGWSDDRRRRYVRWSCDVIDGCRGVNAALEREFDRVVRRALKAIGPAPEQSV
jgi:guanosine-3',5'-bis(diphosphate) 3'-pyrophosphohydrolase